MITKKDIPLDLLKTIDEIALKNLDLIQNKKEENTYYSFIETDPNSKNYFKVYIDGTKVIGNYNGAYVFAWKPYMESVVDGTTHQGTTQDVVNHFNAWIKLIRNYEAIQSVHDDPFVRKFADFYYDEFKILDPDADISPFDPNQQDVILLALDSFISTVENDNNDIAPGQKQEWIQDITEIKNTLNTSTKSSVMKAVSKVLGKMRKHSIDFSKEILKEFKKQLIKGLVDKGVEYVTKAINYLSETGGAQ